MSEDQAVKADTHSSRPASSSSPPSGSSSVNDVLSCQWQACGERLPSPEELYDHVCEKHVGRKSTNNLNLTCQWGNCRTTTVKRDHITSHIRVHVPLKPHKCEFCGKAFKRPQDLKKHVKTHADDSVLLRSPEPSRASHTGINSSYAHSAGKLVADLQSLAANANGYYPDSHSMASSQPAYYSNTGVNHPTYHGGGVPQSGSAYGPVYYAVAGTQNANAEYELRKKAAFDALNEFFGDAKRRVIDPATYYDVGQRLAGINSVQLPMLSGYGTSGVDSHYSSHATAHAPHQPLLQQQYSLPLPNLRTKNDLLNIDNFLEQLQTTVYENSSQAAQAGVVPNGMSVSTHGMSYGRTSHSPPSLHTPSTHSAVTPGASSTGNETPALTPASSVLSYPSAHSPSSVHSAQTISPVHRTSLGSMYPTLPSVSAMSDFSSFGATSGTPASSLASAFDFDGRRRYSGGTLQRAKPAADDDKTPTPPPSVKVERMATKSRSPSTSTSEESETDPNEAWVENIRIIEALRALVKAKLEKGDYERSDRDEEQSKSAAVASPSYPDKMEIDGQDEPKSLYPVLREVQGEA